jgi:acyl carrier protein
MSSRDTDHATDRSAPGSIRSRLLDGPPAARQRELVGFLVAELREALDMDPSEEFHARSRFTDLGVDSKRALEFKEFLEQELGCSLPTTLIFDYPTPEALSGYILRTAFGAAGPEAAAPGAAPAGAEAPPPDASDEDLLRAKLEKYGF